MFHRSISHSGSPLCAWGYFPPKRAIKAAFDLGSLLGQKTKNKDVLLNTLWHASAEKIVELTEKLVEVCRRIRLLYFRKLYLLSNSMLLDYAIKINYGNLLLISIVISNIRLIQLPNLLWRMQQPLPMSRNS